MTTAEIINQLLSVSGFVSALGWVFAAAMMVGGIIDDGYKNLLHWCFAGAVYVAFQEIARHALLSEMTINSHNAVTAISMITLVVYTTGLSVGWSIAYIAKNRARKNFLKEQNINIEG